MMEKSKEEKRDCIIANTETYLISIGFRDEIEEIRAIYTDPEERILAYGVFTGFLKNRDIENVAMFMVFSKQVKKRFDKMQTTIDSLQHALAGKKEGEA